jgi:hypothetical protein
MFYTVVPPLFFMTHAHYKCNIIGVEPVVVSDTLVTRLFVMSLLLVVQNAHASVLPPTNLSSRSLTSIRILSLLHMSWVFAVAVKAAPWVAGTNSFKIECSHGLSTAPSHRRFTTCTLNGQGCSNTSTHIFTSQGELLGYCTAY